MIADNDDDRVVPLRGSAPEPVSNEEHARRLKVEVDRLARMSTAEWLYYVELPGYAEKYGVDKATLRAMVELVVKEIEKKAREDRGELRRREARDEKRRDTAVRETERKADRAADRAERRAREQERTQERRDREAAKAAERREREEEAKRAKREAAFAEIVDLPQLTHETRLREAATRLGEDAEVMIEEFECFRAARTIPEDLAPWPEPVNTAELLAATEAKFRRYVVASDAVVTASTLWVPFSYVVEIATHAPKLIYTFPLRDAGKSVALQTLRWMVLRAYPAVEITGAALYHVIDRLRPTLILEEGDTLFVRRTVLSSILNQSWTNDGSKITRAGLGGKWREFDTYGAQAISMRGLQMPDTTLSRCIICTLWPKLETEIVDEFTYRDDDEFKVIRRKWLRWAVDNAVTLRDAKPNSPFNNRVRINWKMLFAIADLAGGKWPKRARAAALELETGRDEPNELIRLFAALKEVWGTAEVRTSKSLCEDLVAHSSGEWADFRGKGPISPTQLGALLRPFGIRPIENLLRGRHAGDKNPNGYRRSQFVNAWTRLLQKPSHDPLTPSLGRKPRK
jgi:putative DNA primase/helicase